MFSPSRSAFAASALAALLLLAAPAPGWAQGVRPFGDPIRFRTLDAFPALADANVHAIHEDSLGFLWFGTATALVRYDGYETQTYRPIPFDTTSLPGSLIVGLAGEGAGFWVLDEGGTLSRYDAGTDTFSERPDRRSGAAVLDGWTLLGGSDGTLWIGTRMVGVARFDSETGIVTPLRTAHLTGDVHTQALSMAPDGALWVGSQQDGLIRYDPARQTSRAYRSADTALPTDNVTALLHARDGTLWVGTSEGLVRYNAQTGTFSAAPLDAEPISALLEDPVGDLWLGTQNGVVRFRPTTGQMQRHAPDASDPWSIAPQPVFKLFLDSRGTLWIGTEGGGVSYFGWEEPPLHRTDLGVPGFGVWSIASAPDGTLYAGTTERLYRYAPDGTRTAYRSHPTDAGAIRSGIVMSLRVRDDGLLWVGTRRHDTHPGALHLFDPDAGRVLARYDENTPEPSRLTSDNPWGFFEDSKGRLWVLSGGTGCPSVWNPSDASFATLCFNDENGAPHPAKSMIEQPHGVYWFPTWGGGLLRADASGVTGVYLHDPTDPLRSPASNDVVMGRQAADGAIWLGYYGAGLSRFDPTTETFRHWSPGSSDLPDGIVYDLRVDERGLVWMATNTGLLRFDPADETFTRFGLADGAQDLEFNAGVSHVSAEGELFFGGVLGFNRFFPDSVRSANPTPQAQLTRVAVMGRPAETGPDAPLDAAPPLARLLTLAPRQRDVSFGFATPGATEFNRYRYRLDGYDADWRLAPGRTATYTNLDPGLHTLRVQAAGSGGAWGPERTLTVDVRPMFFETLWFRLLCAAALLGVLALAYRTHTVRSRRRQVTLERTVRERTAELRREKRTTEEQAARLIALDKSRSRFFTNISHELRTPLTLTIGPLEDVERSAELPAALRHPVDLALRNSRRLLRLTNQLLDVARIDAGAMTLSAAPTDLRAFVQACAAPFSPLAERRRVRLDLELPAHPVGAVADAEKLEPVVVNLLSNALKFTPEGGAVRVSLHADPAGPDAPAAACLVVRDSGPGIAPDALPHLFDRFYQADDTSSAVQQGSGIGLALARELATLHGGTLTAESTLGFGATFTLSLPAADAAALPQSGRAWGDRALPVVSPAENGPLDRSSTYEGDGAAAENEAEADRPLVLVVDDHDEIRAYVREHLESDYRVAEAADGLAALESVRATLPDLVVSDVMMPRMDGFDLVRALRADHATDFVPILLLTAKATADEKLEGLGVGADDYLTKPFDPVELRARVANRLAAQKRLLRRLRTAPPPPPPVAPGLSETDAAFVDRLARAVGEGLSDEDFSVEALASAVEQSRSTLHRRMRELLDTTPSAYLRAARLDRARNLLAAREGSVSEVAYTVGFKSVSHFSQAFKRHTGTSPTDFLATTPALSEASGSDAS